MKSFSVVISIIALSISALSFWYFKDGTNVDISESQVEDLSAKDLLHIARLPDDEKIPYLEKKGWIIDNSSETDDKSDNFAFFDKDGKKCNLLQIWDRELYDRYRKQFEDLGYHFQAQGNVGTQYLHCGYDQDFTLCIALFETQVGYFVMLERGKITPSSAYKETVRRLNDQQVGDDSEEYEEKTYYNEFEEDTSDYIGD